MRRSEQPADGVAALARFADELTYARLPAAVRERARLVLLDTLGVMVWGAQDPFLGQLRIAYANAYSAGKATVVGTDQRLDPGPAALLNAAACTVTQFAEGHRRSRGDPGPHIVPTALAVAEVEGSSGEALLTAIVAGYEVAVRAGLALSPVHPDQHVHGHWASLGAAVTAVKLLGGGQRELEHAIDGTAALLIYAPSSTVIQGTTVHHLYVGCGLQAAIGVAYGTRAGMTAVRGTLENYVSRRNDNRFDRSKLQAGLDRQNIRFEILDNYFKLYPVCAQVITVIEAVDELRRQVSDLDQIQTVTIRAAPAAVALCGGRDVHTTLASKFSIPFIAATRLMEPGQSAQALQAVDVAAEPLQRLMERIALIADATLSPAYPDARPVCVEFALKDGRTLSSSKQVPLGDFTDHPIAPSVVVSKFRNLVRPILGAGKTDDLFGLAEAIDTLPSVSPLAAAARRNAR